MADFVFNIAKGRAARYADLPGTGDTLVLILLQTGAETDAAMIDHDTLAAVIVGSAECNFTGYTRRTLANVAVNVDDANDRVDVDADDPASYTNTAASQASAKAVIAYDPTGASPDSALIPLVGLDAVVTFDTDVAVTVAFNAAGIFRAA